ncbi:MAG TPA: lipase maturation factor family protein, partial [Thermoanaerobaculia bacterium]
WLRALGILFFSAFYALWFQIHGLIGPNGILPAGEYLQYAHQVVGATAYRLIPSLLWMGAGRGALTALVIAGLVASVAITVNLWPRVAIGIAMVCYLSFVTAAREFSAYQSDGMLLEAALLSLFLGSRKSPPTRAAAFGLQWLWFRIYFESGLVKILSGEPQWRNLTAMDKYYENGPLPTWLGWHVQQWPHAFHAFSAAATLIVELFVVFLVFVPDRRVKLAAFALTAPLQIGIILTANYAFLNYLVLALGLFLIEDRATAAVERKPSRPQLVILPAAVVLSVLAFFAPLPLLEPFRIVNRYGLFAVMTRARYELEFQGTRDGRTWTAYPFRYKPQDVRRPPGIFAPYQPRFEWNLWFASFGSVSENEWVVRAQQRLLENDPDVLRLFAHNPFAAAPPAAVRIVVWQYWFTTSEERAKTGAWWNRQYVGEYAPALRR